MTGVRRKAIAWLCLSALLIMQLTVAAYACTVSDVSQAMRGSAPAMMDAWGSCADPDHHDAKLCEQHCLQSSQTVDTQPHSVIAMPILPLMIVTRVDDHLPPQREEQLALLATVVDPPPIVRFGVLRI